MSISLDQAVNYRSNYTVKIDSRTSSVKKSGGYSRRKNISRQIVNVFLVFSVIVMSFFGFNANSMKDAQAFEIMGTNVCEGLSKDGVWFNYPEPVFMGPMDTPDPASNKITAYEKFGTSGTNWTVYRGPVDGDKSSKRYQDGTDSYDDSNPYYANDVCFPMPEILSASAGNGIFAVTKVTVYVSGLIYEIAFEKSSVVIENMQEQIGQIISPQNGTRGLKDTLYLDFLIPVIMISALYLGYIGMVKRKQSEALTSGLWMVGAAITGLLLLINPLFIPTAANMLVKSVTEGVMTGITETSASNASNVGSSPENASNLCTVVEDDQTRKITRVVQCTLWYSFIYTPWTNGQYGYTPADPAGKEVFTQHPQGSGDGKGLTAVPLGNENAKPLTWPLFQIQQQTFTGDGVNFDGKADAWQEIPKAQLGDPTVWAGSDDENAGNGSTVNTVWKGDATFGLLSKALFSLLAAGGAGFMIISLGMSMIVFEIGLIILMMMSPLFLLIGVHPGFGRKVALRWLETIISLTLKRIVLAILLGVMISFYSIVISIPESELPWTANVVMIIAISIAGIKYKDTMTDMFTNINLGGGGPMQYESTGGRNMAKGAAAGLIGSAAGLALGAKAAKAAGSGGGGGGAGSATTMGKNGSGSGNASGSGSTQRATPAGFQAKPADGGTAGAGGAGSAGAGSAGAGGAGGATGSDSTGSGGTSSGRAAPEFVDDPSVVDTDAQGNASSAHQRNAPDFGDEDTSTAEMPHVDTRTGVPESDDDVEGNASSNTAHNAPVFDEDGNEVGNAPTSRREQRNIERASEQAAKIDARFDKKLERKTKRKRSNAKLRAAALTIGGATIQGAAQGKYGGSSVIIARQATRGAQKATTKAQKKTTGVNAFSQAARQRQTAYTEAWKEYNNAPNKDAQKEAAKKISEIYGKMSVSEKRHLKSTQKVQNKMVRIQQEINGSGSLPPKNDGQSKVVPKAGHRQTRGKVDPTKINIPKKPSKP